MKVFETHQDIITDEHFKGYVAEVLLELNKERILRPAPAKGYKYKRDWYDKMGQNGQLNTPFFLNNISDIWNKKSNLSRDIRSAIEFVCDKAYFRTYTFYKELDKIEEQAKK